MARVAAVVSNGCSPDPRVLREAKWLVEEGHDVTIHAFNRFEDLPDEENVDGVRIIRHSVGYTPYGGTLSTVRGLRRFRKSVAATIGKVDLVHCHDADTLAVGLATQGSLVLFDMHDLHHTWVLMPNPKSQLRKLVARRFRKVMLHMAAKADAVLTSSVGFQAWLEHCGVKSSVVENRPERRDQLSPSERFTVGYFGKVREIESFELLFNAVRHIPEENRPRLLIAGDGIQSIVVTEMVRSAVSEGWLEAEVFGAFDENQLAEMMAEISVMYAMYPPERGNISAGAIPVKMFEAASYGRPSVVNSGVPMGDLCESENLGSSVEWGDVQGLASALQKLHGTTVTPSITAEREKKAFLKVVDNLLSSRI